MSTWTFCDPATGLFIDRVFSGPEYSLSANTPTGHQAVPGAHDHLCRRLDETTGEVVPYQPEPPAPDEWQTWAWDASTERWVSQPTAAAIARDVRTERDRRMAAADWVTLRAMRTGKPVPAAWSAYLQALADVPMQPDFPQTINWPEVPQ